MTRTPFAPFPLPGPEPVRRPDGALHAEFPGTGPASEVVWHAMPRSVQRGDVGLRLKSILLDGPLTIDKNHRTRRLGTLIGVLGMTRC